MDTRPTVLVVDGDAQRLGSLLSILSGEFDIKTATTVVEGEKTLAEEWVQIILCEQSISGVELLQRINAEWPDVVCIMIASDENISVDGLQLYQYITTPLQYDSLVLTLRNAAKLFRLQRENSLLNIELNMAPQRLVHCSPQHRDQCLESDGLVRSAHSPLNELCERIKNIAAYDISVLISGESGTGKELAARALHYNSPRWDKPFVVENCGALPDELLESELFGCKKGAFTGAMEDRVGIFERADGGTVFLDEIGEISPAFQVKLLRVLQEGEIRPLGCSATRKVDLRVIAATNKDLEEEVRAGRFREDLYYRIAAMTITMPPLRERRGDIPVLAQALLDKAVVELGKAAEGFSHEALACMQLYHWPGNVRELQNEIQQMLVLGREMLLGAELLSPRVLRGSGDGAEKNLSQSLLDDLEGSLKDRVELLEARILRETLIRHRWNKSRAAKELGLSRVGLRSKLERYGLEREAFSHEAIMVN